LLNFFIMHIFWQSGIVEPFGGICAAMHIRCLAGELGCISVSNIFGIAEVHRAFSEDGQPLNDRLGPGAQALVQQLDWHARAMKTHRDTFGIAKVSRLRRANII